MKEAIKKLNRKPARREFIIFIACISVFGFVILDTYSLPNYTKIKELETKLGTKTSFHMKIKESAEKAKTNREMPNNVKPTHYYEQMAHYTYTQGNDLLLKFISSPHVIEPLKLISINTREEKIEENYFSKEIVIVFSGQFIDLQHFITKVEALPILFFIDMIEIGKGVEDFGKIEATIRGTLYGLTPVSKS